MYLAFRIQIVLLIWSRDVPPHPPSIPIPDAAAAATTSGPPRSPVDVSLPAASASAASRAAARSAAISLE